MYKHTNGRTKLSKKGFKKFLIKSELCSKGEDRHEKKSQIRSERKHFCIFYEYCSILVYTSIEDFEYCNTSIEILQYFGHPSALL
jgi:hypothetical protein